MRRTVRGYFSFLVLAFAATLGCADVRAPARLGLKLAPATLGAAIVVQQQLRVERDGRIDELQGVLEIDAERLALVGLAFGQRVLTLQFDGRTLKSWRHPLLPAELREEDVLEDLQLTLWPVAALAPTLPAGWRIEETGRRRVLYSGVNLVTVIDYSAEPPWSGAIELRNLRFGYRLTIQSAPVPP